jgi:HSP20 family molecular chaperone IbpA
MNALSFSNPKPRSNGNAAHSVPAGVLGSFQPEMQRWLDHAFSGFGFTRAQSVSQPATVEIHDADGEYRIAVDVPGVALNDIDLTISKGLLTLRAERPPVRGEALYNGRWSGRFERVIGIGTEVDESRISARLENGVLRITLPKKPEWQPRRIEVQ